MCVKHDYVVLTGRMTIFRSWDNSQEWAEVLLRRFCRNRRNSVWLTSIWCRNLSFITTNPGRINLITESSYKHSSNLFLRKRINNEPMLVNKWITESFSCFMSKHTWRNELLNPIRVLWVNKNEQMNYWIQFVFY